MIVAPISLTLSSSCMECRCPATVACLGSFCMAHCPIGIRSCGCALNHCDMSGEVIRRFAAAHNAIRIRCTWCTISCCAVALKRTGRGRWILKISL